MQKSLSADGNNASSLKKSVNPEFAFYSKFNSIAHFGETHTGLLATHFLPSPQSFSTGAVLKQTFLVPRELIILSTDLI